MISDTCGRIDASDGSHSPPIVPTHPYNQDGYVSNRYRALSFWELTRDNPTPCPYDQAVRNGELAIRQLSERIEKIQEQTMASIQIIGTSALSILNHVYGREPFTPGRDFDCAIVMNQNITNKDALEFGKKIEEATPERLSQVIPSTRPRIPEGLPLGKDTLFSAGYGFYLNGEENDIALDITLFDHENDLQLNGLLARDQLRIVLNQNNSLVNFCTVAKEHSTNQLKEKGWLIDPNQAYSDNGICEPSIVGWDEIKKRPLSQVMRLVRGLAKAGKLPFNRNNSNKPWKNLNQYITSATDCYPEGMSIQLSRILMDKWAAVELIALEELGIFDKWATPLAPLIRELDAENLTKMLDREDNNTPLARLRTLCHELEVPDKLNVIWDVLHPSSMKLVIEELFNVLIPELTEVGEHDTIYLEKLLSDVLENSVDHNHMRLYIQRLVKSTSLSLQEKGELLIREALRLVPVNEKKQSIRKLFPAGNGKYIEDLTLQICRRRIGHMTGVFDPITLAHCDIVRTAIDQMGLDEIYIIPVILKNQGRHPSNWETRQKMISLAIKEIPEAKICDQSIKPFLERGIHDALLELRRNTGNNPYRVHISGTDAYNRYQRYGFVKQNMGITSDRLFVVHRLGMRRITIPKGYEKQISYFQPETPIGMVDQGVMSSTMVRREVEIGNSIQHLVPSTVKEFIRNQFLYKPPFPFDQPFQLLASEKFIHSVKQQLVIAKPTKGDSVNVQGLNAREAAILKAKSFFKNHSKQALAIELRYYFPEGGKELSLEDLESCQYPTIRIEVAAAYSSKITQEPLVFESSQEGPLEKLGTGEELVGETVRQLVHRLLDH